MSRGEKPTSRRDFLREGLRSLVRAGFGGVFERLERMSELMESREPKPMPLHPVLSCETRSLHALISTGQLPLESLPPLLHELDIRGVSLSDRYLPSLQPRVLEPLRETLIRSGLVITGLMVSTPIDIHDEANLSRRLDECIERLQAAAWLGAPLIRLHLGGSGNRNFFLTQMGAPEKNFGEREDDTTHLERAALFLQRLLPEARKRQVRLTLENRDGVTRRAESLLTLVRSLDPRWVGICLDFGNWQPERLYDSCRMLAPYAMHVHAKSRAFDHRGEESQLEFGRLISYLRLADYKGALSIEYMGEDDPIEGIRKTRDLIRRYWRAY